MCEHQSTTTTATTGLWTEGAPLRSSLPDRRRRCVVYIYDSQGATSTTRLFIAPLSAQFCHSCSIFVYLFTFSCLLSFRFTFIYLLNISQHYYEIVFEAFNNIF